MTWPMAYRIITAGLIAAIPMVAEAQLLSGRRGDRYFTDGDLALLNPMAGEMLASAPDGQVRSWSNPESGNSGELRLLRSYQRQGLPCRDMHVSSRAGESGMAYSLTLCRVDGQWKMANR